MPRLPRKDLRRYQRTPCALSVLLAWTDPDGSDRYARGKCRDVSEAGLRVDTVDTIPPQTYVNLRIEKCDLTASARVAILGGRERPTSPVGTNSESPPAATGFAGGSARRLIENSNQSHQKNRRLRNAGSYYTDEAYAMVRKDAKERQ